MSPGRRVFGWLLVASVALLVFLGAQVKSHQAGLAEPDWPLGYGQWMPRMVGNVLHEHGHRVAGALVGVLTIVAAVWTARRDGRAWLRKLGWYVLALVCVQGLLGGLTVKLLLPPAVSVAHGALAQSLLCLVGWWALAQQPSWSLPAAAPLASDDARALAGAQTAALVALVAVFIQLLLGASMRHTESGLVVPFFPVDGRGHWVPDYVDWRVQLHMAHRVWAVVAMAAVWRACLRAGSLRGELLSHGTWLAFAVLAQALLGASVVWMSKHPLVTSLHVINGALVLLGSWLLLLRLWRLAHPVPAERARVAGLPLADVGAGRGAVP